MTKGGKQVTFKVPQSKLASDANQWVHGRGAEPPASDREGGNVTTLKPAEAKASAPEPAAAPKERVARLTIDVPESLHRRLKMQCAARGQKMADVMREMIEREFPDA